MILRPDCLQGRSGVTDIFGRRVDNVENDPGRHDAVNDGLQPGDKNRLSFMGFPANEWDRLRSPLS